MDVSIVFILAVFYCAICFGIYVKMDAIPLLAPFKGMAFLMPILSLVIYVRLLTKKDVSKWRLTVSFFSIREFMMCIIFALSHAVIKLSKETIRTRHNVYRSTAKYNASLKQVNAVKRTETPKGKALYQMFRKTEDAMERRFA